MMHCSCTFASAGRHFDVMELCANMLSLSVKEFFGGRYRQPHNSNSFTMAAGVDDFKNGDGFISSPSNRIANGNEFDHV